MTATTLDRPAAISAPVTYTASCRRKFGSHAEMAHVWAQNEIQSGGSADGRMMFNRGTVYSYGRHFPIAQFTDFVVDGRRVVLFTGASYSVSTSKHVRHVSGAIRGGNVTVIRVPDLREWRAEPAQVAAVFEMIVRRAVSEARYTQLALSLTAHEFEAFRAVFSPLAAMPSDPAAWVKAVDDKAKADRSADLLSTALQTLERLPEPRLAYNETDLAAPTSDRIARRAVGEVARCVTMVRSAALWVSKAKDPTHADVLAAGRAWVKRWAAIAALWTELADAQDFEDQRAARTSEIAAALEAIRSGEPRSWRHSGEMLRHLLRDAAAYGLPLADVVDMTAAVSADMLGSEMDANAYCSTPDWQHQRSYAHAARITADEWQDGKGSASGHSFDDATLVRRVGDRVETSRGAVVPFAAAVLVYRIADRVRRGIAPGQAIGQRVGHYTLDSVDGEGNARIGCHRLDFAEMTRLACREAPEHVKPRYPVPAIVA